MFLLAMTRCFASLNMTMNIFCMRYFLSLRAKAKQSTSKEPPNKESPEKARAKLWRSHSTAALWRLQFLILYYSLILTSQPQRTAAMFEP